MSEQPELPPDLRQVGKLGLGIYRGVIADGGSMVEAINVTAAFFSGMLNSNQTREDETEGGLPEP